MKIPIRKKTILLKEKKIDSTSADQIAHIEQEVFSHENIKLRGALTNTFASQVNIKCHFCNIILPIHDERWIDHIYNHVNLKKVKNEETNKLKCCYDFCLKEFKVTSILVNHIISHMGLKLLIVKNVLFFFLQEVLWTIIGKKYIKINLKINLKMNLMNELF